MGSSGNSICENWVVVGLDFIDFSWFAACLAALTVAFHNHPRKSFDGRR
jgi:hypothetical protein